jgi:hypothetical protein
MTIFTITKLDCARNQLDCAIDLWFHDNDAISTHTVAFAAFEIINNLNEHLGKPHLSLQNVVKQITKPGDAKNMLKTIKGPMCFFKHADKDPTATMIFNDEVNELVIAAALVGLKSLDQATNELRFAFMSWLHLHERPLLQKHFQPIPQSIPVEQITALRVLSKTEFLEVMAQKFRTAFASPGKT